jgi:hypothetical protein
MILSKGEVQTLSGLPPALPVVSITLPAFYEFQVLKSLVGPRNFPANA